MTLYGPEGQDLSRPTEEQPRPLGPPMPMNGAVFGALVFVLADGNSMVWPLTPEQNDMSVAAMDFGDGPEPVMMAMTRRKYNDDDTGERVIALVATKDAPAWLASLLRGQGFTIPDDVPDLGEDGIAPFNMAPTTVGPNGGPPLLS